MFYIKLVCSSWGCQHLLLSPANHADSTMGGTDRPQYRPAVTCLQNGVCSANAWPTTGHISISWASLESLLHPWAANSDCLL